MNDMGRRCTRQRELPGTASQIKTALANLVKADDSLSSGIYSSKSAISHCSEQQIFAKRIISSLTISSVLQQWEIVWALTPMLSAKLFFIIPRSVKYCSTLPQFFHRVAKLRLQPAFQPVESEYSLWTPSLSHILGNKITYIFEY